LQDGAILDRKEALVARTFKSVFRLRIIDRARKMSAFLAVAYVFVLGGPDHYAVVFLCRVAEQLHSPDGNLSEFGHRLLGVDGSLVEK
jgi:hypothetical protein